MPDVWRRIGVVDCGCDEERLGHGGDKVADSAR
jgi:hypothetical protein